MRKPRAPASHLAPSPGAIPFLKTAADADRIVLTTRQREELTQISTRLRLPARKVIYREDSPAEWVFSVVEGAVKSYRELPSGKRALSAFLFSRDLFGLAEKGRYVNTAQAIVPVTLYRFSLSQLTLLLKQDADLQFQFLAKVTHELSKRSGGRFSSLDVTPAAAWPCSLRSWPRAQTDGGEIVRFPCRCRARTSPIFLGCRWKA